MGLIRRGQVVVGGQQPVNGTLTPRLCRGRWPAACKWDLTWPEVIEDVYAELKSE